jgi:glycosyltransferase involved in cell wall biosynthesis
VGVSAGVADELHRLGGIPSQRIVTINNPVIGPDFAARTSAPVEHPWLHDPDHKLFITAGRLVSQKDHATMLRAMALHRQSMPSRLLILGTGPLEAELKAMVAALDLGDAVQFVGYRGDAPAWFPHADAFLLSSRSEGFGNVMVEAMGCGTPVIATDCAYGPGEILERGRYGLLAPVGDPAALAQAMNQVGTLRTRFPAEILRARAGGFTYDACAAGYISVFEALVPKHVWALPA